MEKVFFRLLLIGCLLCTGVLQSGKGNAACAATLAQDQKADLGLKGARAQISVTAQGNTKVKKMTYTYTLQKKSGESWKKYFSWTGTHKGTTFAESREYQLAEKGKYRVKLKVTYYSSSESYTSKKYSGEITY